MAGPESDQEQRFNSFLSELSLPSDRLAEAHRKFRAYEQLLISWNNKINLISHNDLQNLGMRHFGDALMAQRLFPQLFGDKPIRVIDVGSGAGFPGFPLLFVHPSARLSLVESIQKKCSFLKEVGSELNLDSSAEVLCGRSEELAHLPGRRERYDLAVTRALAKSATVLELVLPFVQVGGHGLFWVSGAEWDERGRIEKVSSLLGARIVEDRAYILPGDESGRERRLILFEKISPTPPAYPRRTGLPEKKPLS